MPQDLDRQIDELKERLAELESAQPKRKKKKDDDWASDAPIKDACGVVRDGRGKVVQTGERAVARTDDEAKAIRLTARFERLTKGLYADSPELWASELDSFIEANGSYQPSRFRDPMGMARNRNGQRLGAAQQHEREVADITRLQAEANRK